MTSLITEPVSGRSWRSSSSPGLWGMAHGLFLITLSLGPPCFHSPPPNPSALCPTPDTWPALGYVKTFLKSFNGFIWENTKWCLCALKISLCEPCFEVIVPPGKEGRNSLEHLHIYWQSKKTRICLYWLVSIPKLSITRMYNPFWKTALKISARAQFHWSLYLCY